MADPQLPLPVPPPAAPAESKAETTPLDQAPLAEFVKRREGGEQQPAAEPPEPQVVEPEEDPLAEPAKPTPGKKNFQSRFDQVYRQRSEALRALEQEKGRAAALEKQIQDLRGTAPLPQPSQPQLPAEPTPPNLDEYLAAGKSYEDWVDARIEYRAQRIADDRITSVQRKAAQDQQDQQIREQTAGFGDRTEAARTKYPDYDTVVVQNDRVQLSPVMMDIARRSPHGPDIMYWLGTHEADANQLGLLTANYPPASYPLVEAHLLLLSGKPAPSTPSATKAVSVSKAPAPISPVGGGSTTSAVPLDQMPLGDFVKRRNAADLKKRTG